MANDEQADGPIHPKRVVVCGAGVMGACTAYFLAQHTGVQVTVVERSAVACAASGKAGGFLALDWCDASSQGLGRLARASFRIHEQLAAALGGGAAYGYRRLDSVELKVREGHAQVAAAEGPSASSSSAATTGSESGGAGGSGESKPVTSQTSSLPAWLDGRYSGSAVVLGTRETNAQVHPRLFTRTVLDTAVARYGVKLVIGEVKEIRVAAASSPGVPDRDGGSGASSRVTGVALADRDEVLDADAVVITLGPWSGTQDLVARLTTMTALRVPSIVLAPREPAGITPHAVFLAYQTAAGKSLDPEIYPRGSGEVYICGCHQTEPALPADPDHIAPTADDRRFLTTVAAAVSSKLAGADVTAEQACYLPCVDDGVPLIGRIPGVRGAFVGTGHSCWGILLAPATGAALAELIALGNSTAVVDLAPFDPARFVKRGST